MTVIAWDGIELAADRQMTSGNIVSTTNKLRRLRGHLCAVTGGYDQGEEMFAWFERGADPKDFPPMQRDKDDWAGLVVVTPESKVLKYERTPYPIRFEAQRIAFGSGRDFALAAMYLGKTAREAVEVASVFDYSCGFGVDTLSLLVAPYRGGLTSRQAALVASYLCPPRTTHEAALRLMEEASPEDFADALARAKLSCPEVFRQ